MPASPSGASTARQSPRIAKSSGVAPHVIVGIIGCETFFGRITGKFRVVDALSTLAFDYPPRVELLPRGARAVPAARARGRLRHQGGARLLRGRDGQRPVHAAQLPGLGGRRRRRRQARPLGQLARRHRERRKLPRRPRLARRRAGRRACQPLVPESGRPRSRQARARLDGQGAARPRARIRDDPGC